MLLILSSPTILKVISRDPELVWEIEKGGTWGECICATTKAGKGVDRQEKKEEGLQAQGSTTEEKKTMWGADLGLKMSHWAP